MSFEACAALVERGDPWRFACAMAAPVAARRVLFPLYAFNIEVARAPWVTQEPMIAEMRLQWWRDALEEIANGGPVRRHEVVGSLAEVLDADAARLLDRLVEARRWDIYKEPFEDAQHLTHYLEDTAACLMRAGVRALGGADAGVSDYGFGAGLAMFLQAVPELEARGRVPLVDGRPEGVASLAREGLARLRSGRKALRLSREAKAALFPGVTASALLARVVARPGLVAAGGVQVSEAGRKLRLIRASAFGRV